MSASITLLVHLNSRYDTLHAAKNTQVTTNLLTSCNNSLQQTNNRMRSHGLRQPVDHKFVAGCPKGWLQVDCQNLSSTGLLQIAANDKLPDFNRLVAT